MKTLIIGSSTRTIKAQEILRRHGISAQITRLDSVGEGCIRGLRLEDGMVSRAVSILVDSGIPVKGAPEAGR